MDRDNFLLAVAVIAVVVSFIGFSVTYNSVTSFQNFLTGFSTENGTVNLTVTSTAIVNITHAGGALGETLDFGSGFVDGGADYAILATNDTGSCLNCGGSWATYNEGFTVENIGTVDVVLNITGVQASTFIGGTGPEFEFNFSNNDSGDASCSQWNLATAANNSFVEFTNSEFQVCDNFNFETSTDTVDIDFRIVVPSDADPGAKGAIIQLHFESV